jgi:ferredoxin--NADP+ reductase
VEKSLFDQLNATVTARQDISPGLFILRVESDGDLFEFVPGQYCVLGLPPQAPRCEGADEEPPPKDEKEAKKRAKMIRRAYSIASSSKVGEYLEFYVTLVQSGGLTPRLYALKPGDRIWLGPKATGLFTMQEVPDTADLFLLATGTGLAPYVSMIRTDLLDRDKARRIVIAHGARYSWDLGYRAELEGLAHRHENLIYVPSITRPGDDPSWQGETGYLQDQLADGRLEELSEVALSPATCHVFLCGNPAMIEAATEFLVKRDFKEWTRQEPEGQIHLEKYW